MASTAVGLTSLEMVRTPLVVDAPTLNSHSEKATPLGKETSMRVSRGCFPIVLPLCGVQLAMSPYTEGNPVKVRIHDQW